MTMIHVDLTPTELDELVARHDSLWWNGTRTRWNTIRMPIDSWCLITADKARTLLHDRHPRDDQGYHLVIGIATDATPDVDAIWSDPVVDVVTVIGINATNRPREFTFGPVSDHGQRTELWVDLAVQTTSTGWRITSTNVDETYREWREAFARIITIGDLLIYLPVLSMLRP